MGEPTEGDLRPRLEPLPPAEWDELLRELIARSDAGADRPLNIFTTLARNPKLFRSWLRFAGSLLDGRLSTRQRELAILRVSHLCRSHYEWVQHVPIARSVGVTEAEMAALGSPIESWGWPGSDAQVLAAADELHRTGSLSDATWLGLSHSFGEAELIELVMLVAHYHMLAMVIGALRVQPEPGINNDPTRDLPDANAGGGE